MSSQHSGFAERGWAARESGTVNKAAAPYRLGSLLRAQTAWGWQRLQHLLQVLGCRCSCSCGGFGQSCLLHAEFARAAGFGLLGPAHGLCWSKLQCAVLPRSALCCPCMAQSVPGCMSTTHLPVQLHKKQGQWFFWFVYMVRVFVQLGVFAGRWHTLRVQGQQRACRRSCAGLYSTCAASHTLLCCRDLICILPQLLQYLCYFWASPTCFGCASAGSRVQDWCGWPMYVFLHACMRALHCQK